MHNMPLKEALTQAQDQQRAILATNFYNLETLQGIALAAAKKEAPVILQLTRGSIEYMGLNTAVAMARAVISEFDLQAWLHLDHGDSLELVRRCLDAGFDSVMIDGSELPFEKNIEVTAQVVDSAKRYGAMVEAELGYVAKLGQSADKTGFTEPDEAKTFVDETGVDALAVAIGSAHGFYKKEPKLDIDRLEEIHAATAVALVLHGGSGIPVDQIKKAIKAGICKINVATDTKNAFMKNLKENICESDEIDLRRTFPNAVKAVSELIERKLEIVSE